MTEDDPLRRQFAELLQRDDATRERLAKLLQLDDPRDLPTDFDELMAAFQPFQEKWRLRAELRELMRSVQDERLRILDEPPFE